MKHKGTTIATHTWEQKRTTHMATQTDTHKDAEHACKCIMYTCKTRSKYRKQTLHPTPTHAHKQTSTHLQKYKQIHTRKHMGTSVQSCYITVHTFYTQTQPIAKTDTCICTPIYTHALVFLPAPTSVTVPSGCPGGARSGSLLSICASMMKSCLALIQPTSTSNPFSVGTKVVPSAGVLRRWPFSSPPEAARSRSAPCESARPPPCGEHTADLSSALPPARHTCPDTGPANAAIVCPAAAPADIVNARDAVAKSRRMLRVPPPAGIANGRRHSSRPAGARIAPCANAPSASSLLCILCSLLRCGC